MEAQLCLAHLTILKATTWDWRETSQEQALALFQAVELRGELVVLLLILAEMRPATLYQTGVADRLRRISRRRVYRNGPSALLFQTRGVRDEPSNPDTAICFGHLGPCSVC